MSTIASTVSILCLGACFGQFLKLEQYGYASALVVVLVIQIFDSLKRKGEG